jgi:hypothetical protein
VTIEVKFYRDQRENNRGHISVRTVYAHFESIVTEIYCVWTQFFFKKITLSRYLTVDSRDENGTDIFRPYSRPNPFSGVLIRPYPSPDI